MSSKHWTFKHIAAIDIGSNALRLVISAIYRNDPENIKTIQYLRLPLRLGDHVFQEGKIPKEKAEVFLEAMHAFSTVMKIYHVEEYRAVATSAMREAENNKEIVNSVKERTGVSIDIVSGEREAELIYNAHFHTFSPANKILFVDVGGGSTEITLFENGVKQLSRSFRLGTVRILDSRDDEDVWAEMKSWLKKEIADHKIDYVLGSGGNINKMLSMMGISVGKTSTRSRMKSALKRLSSYSYRERIVKFRLNPDRADVIIPATEVFIAVMKAARVNKVATAGVGLRDGILHEIRMKYYKNTK